GLVQSLDSRGLRRLGEALGRGQSNRQVLSRRHAGLGGCRARAAGVQRTSVSEPRLGALPDDRQDLSDLPRARFLRGRAPGPPTRPGTVSQRRGLLTAAAAVRALWVVLALGVGGCAVLGANSSGNNPRRGPN